MSEKSLGIQKKHVLSCVERSSWTVKNEIKWGAVTWASCFERIFPHLLDIKIYRLRCLKWLKIIRHGRKRQTGSSFFRSKRAIYILDETPVYFQSFLHSKKVVTIPISTIFYLFCICDLDYKRNWFKLFLPNFCKNKSNQSLDLSDFWCSFFFKDGVLF